jgi:hypothetical protein
LSVSQTTYVVGIVVHAVLVRGCRIEAYDWYPSRLTAASAVAESRSLKKTDVGVVAST